MASSMPAPLHIIQDSRYAKQDDWWLDDISLCSSGNIAVSGHNDRTYQSYVSIYGSTTTDDNSDSIDKPTLIYHKEFTDEELSWRPNRYISFIKPNSTEIVTCRKDEVQVIDYNRDVVLRSRKVNRDTTCLSVSESQIFIGLFWSDIVNIYDNDLNEIKSIRLKGIGADCPGDIAAAADILCVCTFRYNRVIVYNQDSGSMLTEYTIEQYDNTSSIAVNVQLGLAAVLWYQDDPCQTQINFYLLSENKSFLTVHVEFGVSRIRISDQARIVTGIGDTREVKVYNLASLFSYSRLKENLVSRLGRDDCENLADFFDMGGEVLKGILNSERPASTLLLALEERGIIQPSNVDRLEEAFRGLEMGSSFYHAVNMYQKLTDTPTISSFEKFVAGFSTFLTSDLFEALCEQCNISASEKSKVLSDNAPGLSLLALLKTKNIITPTDVSALAIPAFVNLKQVMAKINRYQRDLRESKMELQRELTLEEKADIFIHYLHLNIKSWYESICPLPWKKASHWGLSDLFIACGLTLTNTKSHTSLQNVDTKCIVTYDDIFKHPSLQDALRIVVEGNPGSGKTMLASQIAYDWTEGKFEKIEFAILLQLKYMEDMTIPEAITKLILPLESPLTESDVEDFLENAGPCKVCLILDGLEEYTGGGGKDSGPQKSEVMKVMHGEKLPATKVIITTRSEYLQDLPKCPMLKFRQFGKQERDKYVEKIFPQDIEKRVNVIMAVENNPLLLELCDVPLLFVMAVHNIDRIYKASDGETEKVTPFVRNMIQTLCTVGHERAQLQDQLEKSKGPDSDKYKTIESDDSEIFLLLEEVAFNGLCTGKQQLLWPMTFVQNNISDFGTLIDSGILVIEEEIRRTKRSVTKETTMKVPIADDPSASAKSREDLTEMDIETKAMRPEIQDDAPISVSDVAASSGDNQHTLETNIDRDISKNAITILQARFLHKIIQEWFAAKHLYNILEKYNQDEVERCLNLISPIELHYVLRFACGIGSKASPLILAYLNKYHRGLDNDKQGPVANCIFQCFLEHSGDRKELKEVVRDFCKTAITICEEDSQQLQKAKISLLNFASENKILVLKVNLVDVWKSLIKRGNTIRLYLNSGVYLPPLHEVQSLMITSWDVKIQDLDCNLLMEYLYEWPSLQEVDLRLPASPQKLGKDLMNKVSLTDKQVTWSINSGTHYLNEKGEWPFKPLAALSSSSIPSTYQQQRMEDEDVDVTTDLHKEQLIDVHGGTLFLSEADISLHVPAGALNDEYMLRVTVPLDPKVFFRDHEVLPRITPLIICEPDNLRFHVPVKLTLPHCAVLKNPRNHRVEVKFGHKASDTSREMTWSSENVECSLGEHYCTVFLNHFCGVDVSIGSEEKILRVIPYSQCGKSGKQVLTVWLCNDLESDFESVLQSEEKNEGIPLDSYDTFRLRCVSGPDNTLNVRFDVLEGSGWIPNENETRSRTINVQRLLFSNKSKCNFRLISDGENDKSYMYFHLRVTQDVGNDKTETTFVLRKRICDLKIPAKFTRPLPLNKHIGHLFPTGTEASKRPYTAIVYMDPVQHVNDDVITTLWLWPFDSTTEIFKLLQEEQELQYRYQVDTENSFSIVDEKPHIITKTRFLNGYWLLSPEEMKIETDRIRFGSRAKFQFIGKRRKQNETEFIEVQVETFQVEEEIITFIKDVELKKLLYEKRQEATEKVKAPGNDEYSKSSYEDQSNKPFQSQSELLPSTSFTAITKEPSQSKQGEDRHEGIVQSQQMKPNTYSMTDTFQLLAKKLTDEWKPLGRKLRLDEPDIYRIERDFRGTEETIYQMLLCWKKKEGSSATYAVLVTALKEVGRKDLAEKVQPLKDLFEGE